MRQQRTKRVVCGTDLAHWQPTQVQNALNAATKNQTREEIRRLKARLDAVLERNASAPDMEKIPRQVFFFFFLQFFSFSFLCVCACHTMSSPGTVLLSLHSPEEQEEKPVGGRSGVVYIVCVRGMRCVLETDSGVADLCAGRRL